MKAKIIWCHGSGTVSALWHCLSFSAALVVYEGVVGAGRVSHSRSSFLTCPPCVAVLLRSAHSPGACYPVVFLLRSTPPSTCACLCLGVQSIRGFSERPRFCLCQQDPSGFYRQYLRVWGLLWSHTSRSCVVISQEWTNKYISLQGCFEDENSYAKQVTYALNFFCMFFYYLDALRKQIYFTSIEKKTNINK